jgi:hypothetical protein
MATVQPNKLTLFIWAGPYKTNQPSLLLATHKNDGTAAEKRAKQPKRRAARRPHLPTAPAVDHLRISFLSAHGKHHGGEQREGGSGAAADVGEGGVREELL